MPKDNPEERARETIDKQLIEAGWKPIDRNEYESGMHAVAVREMSSGNNKRADYILFLQGMAVGVVEAKRDDIELLTTSHITQVVYYANHPKDWYKSFAKKLPFVWLANGKEILFKDHRDDETEFVSQTSFLRPKDIARLLDIRDEWAGLPNLNKKGLRDCQYRAVNNLEESFREGNRKALIVLATGAGKTFAACLTCYRWLTYTNSFKRILFLVDRNNLAQQACDDFNKFTLTEGGAPFTSVYNVCRIKNHKIPSKAAVVVSTIQGLYAYLNGEHVSENDNDESGNDNEQEHKVTGKAKLPHDFFDLIIIDECHRSIYNDWGKVLEYFDTARMIGLTATPTPEAEAFFDRNTVINYTYGESVRDHINVEYIPYLIKTQANFEGGTIAAEERIKERSNYTKKEEVLLNTHERTYTPEELNRSIINPSSIRLVLEKYRDAVYTELFCENNGNPRQDEDFTFLPKTLVFALNDDHATRIEKIAREVFGKSEEKYPHFVQKITYTADDSNALIKSFRNDVDFRIAITVTLVSTGTDVKPIEVLMFMRYVESSTLYNQMIGRGVRTISSDKLRNVTPNADSKTVCYVVDAVGVTENAHSLTRVNLSPQTSNPSLKTLLEQITYGKVDDFNLRLLASRIIRIDGNAGEKEKEKFLKLSGESMNHLFTTITKALEDGLPPYIDVNNPNAERLALVSSLRSHADAREYLLELNAGKQTILLPGSDKLLYKGFSTKDASEITFQFEEYVKAHSDEIEALRIIFNHQNFPITREMLEDLQEKLLTENRKFTIQNIWRSYDLKLHDNVKTLQTRSEKEALTNLIQLVRFAYKQVKRLSPMSSYANRLFNLWIGRSTNNLTEQQKRLFEEIKDYVVANGSADIRSIGRYNSTLSIQLVLSYKQDGITDSEARRQADEGVRSLSQFIINNNYDTAV